MKKTLKNNSTFLEVGETMNKDKMVLQNTDIGKDNHQFDDIVKIVESAKDRAYRKVNEVKKQVMGQILWKMLLIFSLKIILI